MKRICALGFAGCLLLSGSALARDASISGDYLEVRTADVWTGPCFANGEVNLEGQEAILAWKVDRGQWQGISLDGLSVVAVVRASATLGDPHANPYPASSVLVVDEKATSRQRQALVELARSAAGPLLDQVVWVRSAPIEVNVADAEGFATLKAGDVAELKTRPLSHHDMHCGNEEVYYPPLTELQHAHPAYTLVHRFEGDGLNTRWSSPDKRSAFIGHFTY